MTPKVSVVMPVYNGERFVGEAIESILSQTFTDFELIAIDDGSQDGSLDVVQSYAAKDPRVQACRLPRNVGVSAARNAGAVLANGEFVAVMDADDVSLPERLERQISFLRDNPEIGIVGSNVQIIDDKGRRGRIHEYPAQPATVAWSMLFFNPIAHSAVLMRRDLLGPSGAYPIGCFDGTEDYAVFSQLGQTCRMANLTDVLVLYRSWNGNTTKSKWAQQEHGAAGIAAKLAGSWGVSLSTNDAAVLRDLSRAPYPRDPVQLETAAATVQRWTEVVLGDPRWNAEDHARIKREAAVKLLLIGSLVLTRSPLLALAVARAAIRLSPAAPVFFATKAVRALGTRAGKSVRI